MKDHERAQYENLRYHFDRIVDAILGTGYWNDGLDIYTVDLRTSEDIIEEYFKVEYERDSWKKTALIFGGAFVLMAIVVLYLGVH